MSLEELWKNDERRMGARTFFENELRAQSQRINRKSDFLLEAFAAKFIDSEYVCSFLTLELTFCALSGRFIGCGVCTGPRAVSAYGRTVC